MRRLVIELLHAPITVNTWIGKTLRPMDEALPRWPLKRWP